MKPSKKAMPPYGPAGAILIAAWLGWTGIAGGAAFDSSHAAYEALLNRVVADGRVDYKGLKADSASLDRYLDSTAGVAKVQFNAWPEPRQLAFLINLYNAATLKLIADHYPVDSIKDIGNFFRGPWDQPVVRLFGSVITLDTLEHDIIRKQYEDARIHMALVCAAKGCPPLRSEAYAAARLNAQLDEQAREYLSSPAGLHIDRNRRVVYFSSIFKWYGDDFVAGYAPSSGFVGLDKTEQAVANFCSEYLPAAQSAFLETGDYAVKYLDYDWSLNE